MRLAVVLIVLAALHTAAAQDSVPVQQTGAAAGDHVLEDGTPVKLQLADSVSSANAKEGQEIVFEVVDDIDIAGVTVLRRGSSAIGVVTEAATKKRMGRAGRLSFSLKNVDLADGEPAPVRSVSDSKGDSHVKGMVGLMVDMPLVAAPFFLLLKGSDTAFPKGTEFTAFIDGDLRLDLSKFAAPTPATVRLAVKVSLRIESNPDGAAVGVDGVSVGSTPVNINLDSGAHKIMIVKAGFSSWSQTVEVTSTTGPIKAVLAAAQGQ